VKVALKCPAVVVFIGEGVVDTATPSIVRETTLLGPAAKPVPVTERMSPVRTELVDTVNLDATVKTAAAPLPVGVFDMI
jgi:hypothetical protein